MADPMTQSTQISSSQGLNEGHTATSKDSKFSDSFFSSPVSLIQSPQDKRVVLGSEKPSENMATSLRFSSQPSSFSQVAYGIESSGPPGDYIEHSFKEKRELFDSPFGSQKQDSPIKTSPVSERIKALEALAAKKNDFDRNDGGFPHFKERHYEKFPTESHGISSRLSFQKRSMSNEQESPESPFEVLGETRHGSDFEDTADWMRAHLPPAPDFNIEDPDLDEEKDSPMMQESPCKAMKGNGVDAPEGAPETFTGVPDQFMDSPVKLAETKYNDDKRSKQESVEEDSEFDMRFLPTAYMWDKQEKTDVDTQGYQIVPDNQELPASPAPSADFESLSSPVTQQMDPSSTQHSSTSKENLEPAEILEVDSSGESDDTVIEEVGSIPAVGNNDLDIEPQKDEIMPDNEKQLIQVPIINVIETEEQVLSDEEEEQLEVEGEEDDNKCQIIQGEGRESIEQHEQSEVPEHVSVETLNEENKTDYQISSQTNQTDSDGEYFPNHVMIEEDHESGIFLQSSPDSSGLISEDSQVQSPMSQNLVSFEPLEESTLDKELDKTGETLSDLPPNKNYPSNEPSDVETYLDHYASEELALKDQLNSDYFMENKREKTELSKPSCLPENQNISTFVQESFEENITDDFDETPNRCKMDNESAPEHPISDPLADTHDNIETIVPQNKMPTVDSEDHKSAVESENFTLQEQEELPIQSIGRQSPVQEIPPALFHFCHNEQSGKINEVSDPMTNDVAKGSVLTNSEPGVLASRDVLDRPDSPETISDTENVEPEFLVTAATDSFVEFMRECLKSRQDEEPEGFNPGQVTIDQNPKSDALAFNQSSPAMIMDLEQERLTISALKELGSSQEEEEKPLIVKTVLKPDEATENLEASITSSSVPQNLPNEYQPDALIAKEVEAIDIWVAEAYHLAEHVLTAILNHLSVNDLVHWRDPKKSGVVFGLSMLVLLSLAAFSVISVVSYLLLALLCVTISFRIYKSVVQAVQKSNEGHPFKALMDKDVTIPPETFRKHVDLCLTHINCALKKMSRLFLIEDLVDSLKLAVVMWLMTYVGAVFNGITILILADILLFSVPPVYEKNKTQIDHYIGTARNQVNSTMAKLQEKLPGAMKRCKTE
ncbi:reticulon-3-like isoform X1 [Myxocyprinus asiaticus]|uniref:reticulon-3-like isoform X1 n=1 Tax=Myxocyprinus asiaticus TaxID=70543 RepID=UPI00222282A9|nr:reticulon-3-like isoform X1 [Myxocyprinus asiaticus]